MAVGNATIGALKATLGIDTAQFQDGLKKAQSSLGSFGKGASIGLGAIAAAATAVGTALAVGMKNALYSADDLGKLSQKVGVGVKSLSELQYAADLSDVSLEGLGTGLRKLAVNMAGIGEGGAKPAAAALAQLGLSATDAAGSLKAPDALFKEIAGKFAGMEDGAKKTALAVALFGKSGSDLIPLLNSGSTGLADMATEAAQLGVVIDEKTSAAAEQFNDNLTRLGKVGTGITTQLAAQLAPTMARFSEILVSAAKNTTLMKSAGDLLAGTLKGLVTVGVVVGAALKLAFDNAVATAGAASLVFQGKFVEAFETYKKGIVSSVDTIKGTIGVIGTIWKSADAAVAGHTAKVQTETVEVEKSTKAHTGRATAVRQSTDETARAIKGLDDYIARLKDEAEELGKTRAEMILIDAQRAASGAPNTPQGQAKAAEIMALASAAALAAAKGADMAAVFASVKAPEIPKITESVEGLKLEAQSAGDAAFEAFNEFGARFDDIFRNISNKNWAGAFAGLKESLKSLKTAFAAGGTTGGKIGAVAGIADAAGQAIGGTTGGVISGIASGAAAGAAFGPIGAGVGAVVGGILGIFGASKAKKQQKAAEAKAKADEAARVAAEAAAKAEAIANEKRALEIQLMELSGDSAGALAATRADELAAMDESNRALAQQVYDRIDAAQAEAKAADLNNQIRALDIELMLAQGKATEALAAQRALELEALPESLRALKQQVFAAEDAAKAEEALADKRETARDNVAKARDALTDAYEREVSALTESRDKFLGFADGIGAVIKSLSGSDGLKDLAAEFRRVGAMAQLGNTGALGQIQTLAPAYADSIRNNAGSAVEAARGIAGIRSTLAAAQGTALRLASVDQLQLDALDEQTRLARNIDAGLLTVNEAMAALNVTQTALAELEAVQGPALVASVEGLRGDLRIGLAAVASASQESARILRGATTEEGLNINTVAA